MAASAIAPLLRRLSGEGKKGKKIILTDEQSEDAMNVLQTLSLNAYCLGVLAGNGGLEVLATFCHDKVNRKNVAALSPCYYVCARMIGSTPHLAEEAVKLGLVKSAAAAVSPEHKRADLPMKRACLALLWATASYPERREDVGLSGGIFGASYLLMYGGRLHRNELKGKSKKSLEAKMRESAFVKKKVESVRDQKLDPLPANSEAEQLCCGLLWYASSCSANRLMVIRANGHSPVCSILRRESFTVNPISNGDKRQPKIPRDVIVRLEKASSGVNVVPGFNERKFLEEDVVATEHSLFSSAESACGLVWNLLADSIAQLAVLEERGPHLLCLFAEKTIDCPASTRSELGLRWGAPEKSMSHLAFLFPGQDKAALIESQEKASKTAQVLKKGKEMADPFDDDAAISKEVSSGGGKK